jgi:hypothetical protein
MHYWPVGFCVLISRLCLTSPIALAATPNSHVSLSDAVTNQQLLSITGSLDRIERSLVSLFTSAIPDGKHSAFTSAIPDGKHSAFTKHSVVYVTACDKPPAVDFNFDILKFQEQPLTSFAALFQLYPDAQYCFEAHDPLRTKVLKDAAQSPANGGWYIFITRLKPTRLNQFVNGLFTSK